MKLTAQLSFLATFALAACGAIPSSHDGAQEPQSTKSADFSVVWAEVEPANPSEAWAREFHIQVKNPDQLNDHWTVEKRFSSDKSWKAVGFTDSSGEFIDNEVSKNAEYRFGQVLETGTLPAAYDTVLEGHGCPRKISNAYRVIVPKGATLTTGTCESHIDAEIFQVDGTFAAFDASSSGGASAGKLIVRAHQLRGTGTIRLDGQQGAKGKTGLSGQAGKAGNFESPNGSNGTNGGVGQVGGRGGDGGTIEIRSSTQPLFTLSAQAGPGGLGGEGGAGGAGGPAFNGCRTRFHGPLIGEFEECKTGQVGKTGASGARGVAGQRGSGGNVKVSNEFR